MNTTTYTGIDYGLNRTNKNHETGIRFGVISQNSCDFEALEFSGGFDNAYTAAYDAAVKEAEAESENEDEFNEDKFEPYIENAGFLLENEQYAIQDCLDTDLMICKSPYFSYAQFCSPCVPGACNLESPLETQEENNKCYCLGHDWFEGNKAPYPVYSVETGELI